MKTGLEITSLYPVPPRGQSVRFDPAVRRRLPAADVLGWAYDIGGSDPGNRRRTGNGTPDLPYVLTTVGDWWLAPPIRHPASFFNIGGRPIQRDHRAANYMNSELWKELHPENEKKGPEYPALARELSTLKRSTNVTDLVIARTVRAMLASKALPPELNLLTTLTDTIALSVAALFGAETWRNKVSLLLSLMYLDLVECQILYGRNAKKYGWSRGLSFEHDNESFNNPSFDGKPRVKRADKEDKRPFSGKIPMAGGVSVKGSSYALMSDDYRKNYISGAWTQDDRQGAFVQQKAVNVVLAWTSAFVQGYRAISNHEPGEIEVLEESQRSSHEGVLKAAFANRMSTLDRVWIVFRGRV